MTHHTTENMGGSDWFLLPYIDAYWGSQITQELYTKSCLWWVSYRDKSTQAIKHHPLTGPQNSFASHPPHNTVKVKIRSWQNFKGKFPCKMYQQFLEGNTMKMGEEIQCCATETVNFFKNPHNRHPEFAHKGKWWVPFVSSKYMYTILSTWVTAVFIFIVIHTTLWYTSPC